MICQFALEYASKCLLHTSTNGVTTRTSSPSSDTSNAPLDLTVSRTTEKKESENEPGRGGIQHANTYNGSIFLSFTLVLSPKPQAVKMYSCYRWRARPF